jgi:hypothetical protein
VVQFLIKVILSALIIAAVSELGRQHSLIAAILASLPLTSILAITWLYYDTRDVQAVIALTQAIFWVVLPSLVFFLVLPLLLRANVNFLPALLIACGVMATSYWLYTRLLRQLGVEL